MFARSLLLYLEAQVVTCKKKSLKATALRSPMRLQAFEAKKSSAMRSHRLGHWQVAHRAPMLWFCQALEAKLPTYLGNVDELCGLHLWLRRLGEEIAKSQPVRVPPASRCRSHARSLGRHPPCGTWWGRGCGWLCSFVMSEIGSPLAGATWTSLHPPANGGAALLLVQALRIMEAFGQDDNEKHVDYQIFNSEEAVYNSRRTPRGCIDLQAKLLLTAWAALRRRRPWAGMLRVRRVAWRGPRSKIVCKAPTWSPSRSLWTRWWPMAWCGLSSAHCGQQVGADAWAGAGEKFWNSYCCGLWVRVLLNNHASVHGTQKTSLEFLVGKLVAPIVTSAFGAVVLCELPASLQSEDRPRFLEGGVS